MKTSSIPFVFLSRSLCLPVCLCLPLRACVCARACVRVSHHPWRRARTPGVAPHSPRHSSIWPPQLTPRLQRQRDSQRHRSARLPSALAPLPERETERDRERQRETETLKSDGDSSRARRAQPSAVRTRTSHASLCNLLLLLSHICLSALSVRLCPRFCPPPSARLRARARVSRSLALCVSSR